MTKKTSNKNKVSKKTLKKLKDKSVKLNERVYIGNEAVTSKNLSESLSFLKPGNKKPKTYKFLGVACSVYAGAMVLSWSCKGIGFGEVSFYLSEGKLKIDTEAMSDEFVIALMKEVIKKQKQRKLEIKFETPIANVFDRLWTELGNKDINLQKRKK